MKARACYDARRRSGYIFLLLMGVLACQGGGLGDGEKDADREGQSRGAQAGREAP